MSLLLPPSPVQRKASRIDRPWQPNRFITDAGNAIPARYTPEYWDVANKAQDILFYIMGKR